jgi:hypothetical protein
MINKQFVIQPAQEQHCEYADTIVEEMANSAQARGTGIAKRSPEYIKKKMLEGKAVIALTKTGEWAGFCYIEAWGHEKFVANSGLIVSPQFRKSGLAREIKQAVFKLSRKKYPNAKIFGLTTGAAVMKINSELGYYPVSYSDLTDDEEFWKGCQSCVNYQILTSKNRQNCLCTAMLYVPKDQRSSNKYKLRKNFYDNLTLFERWTKLKKKILLKFNQALNPNLQS